MDQLLPNPLTKNINCRNVRLPKYPLTEVSTYRNVRLPKSPLTEMSDYRSVHLPKYPLTEMPAYRIVRYRNVCIPVFSRHGLNWEIINQNDCHVFSYCNVTIGQYVKHAADDYDRIKTDNAVRLIIQKSPYYHA